ncbi:MAG: ABC transporter permease [Mycobacteriaceae bacterium]
MTPTISSTTTEASPPGRAPATGGSANRRRVLGLLREFALIPPLILVIIVGAALEPVFATTDNFSNILQQSSELAIVVLAESLILIAGKFDLSFESTFGFAVMVGAWLVVPGGYTNGSGLLHSAALGIVITLGAGVLVGLVNAFLIVKLNLNAFIITLGMLILLRGVTVGLVNGQTVTGLPNSFTYLGSARWLGLSAEVWIAGALYVAVGLWVRYHRAGRAIYAIGGNAEAARTAGIRVNRILVSVYVFGGLLAAFAGLMAVGRFGGVATTQGQNMIFTVFAAAVIGGISLKGGKGSIIGALSGVLLLGVVSNLLVLQQVSQYWIDASYGAIILVALAIAKLAGADQD